MVEVKTKKPVAQLLIFTILALLSSLSTSESTEWKLQWQSLTKRNLSSHLRQHSHVLLLYTLPWCGESRSLMNQISHALADRREDDGFCSLNLAVVYRNRADKPVSGGDGIGVLFYYHSVSYRYRGRLGAGSILEAIYPFMSASPEEIPVKSIQSSLELKEFLGSTDKAFVLFDFCRWASKLRAKAKDDDTSQGDDFGLVFGEETDGTQISSENSIEKEIENRNSKCGIDNGFEAIPWVGKFSSANYSAPSEEIDYMSGVRLSCNHEEFKQFSLFFSKFMATARKFFLPTERHRFGLVSEKSLLEYFGIDISDSWLAVAYFAGCPSCLKILKEGNDLNGALQMNNEVVGELDSDEKDLNTVISGNKPLVVLFVDRSSDSSEIKSKSKEALNTFRELALHYLTSYQLSWQNSDRHGIPSIQSNQALRKTSGHPRLKLSPTAQRIKLKDKVSFMVLNEGQHIPLDKNLQGSSLNDILAYVFQRKQEPKLSQIAKEVGFNLLSEDSDVKIVDASQSLTELPSESVSLTLPEEGPLVKNAIDSDNDQSNGASSSIEADSQTGAGSRSTFEPSNNEEEKATSANTNEHQDKKLMSESLENMLDHKLTSAEDVKVEEKSSVHNLGEPQVQLQGFKGSFFFSDGNYRLLRALTGGSTIPSMVIVDPISQQHYVFPGENVLDNSSITGFLHGFLNGSLLPYQSSESIHQISTDTSHPSFVNMDVLEADSIPRITAHSFSELVFGLNQSNNEKVSNAWHEDVLVLFSNSWCGFCQRMELVVREVYGAIKDYMKMLKNGCKHDRTDLCGENWKDVSRFPRIYLMDCTLNDCSSTLQSLFQRELYPSLILFPAEKRVALSYEGDLAVADIIKFMADHGNNSRHLISGNGILWTSTDKGAWQRNMFENLSPTPDHDGILTKETIHKVLLKSKTSQRADIDILKKPHSSNPSHTTTHHVTVGSILLASDIITTSPFDKSKVLIVKADKETGFEGLILNKHIRWNFIRHLGEGLEFLEQAPVSFGGPLIKQHMPLASLTKNITKSMYPEVLSGVYFLDQYATINEIKELKHANHSISEYWFFLGYTSWDWDQLFDEISKGAWITGDDNEEQFEWPSFEV